ncbi:hypothetical protein ACWEPC_54605 [Nonomuraea sp. NPDC004297]
MTRTRARIADRLMRWWLPLSLAAGALAGAGYALAGEAVYTADAYVVVVADGDPERAANFATAYARISAHPGFLTGAEAEQAALSVAASPDAPLVRLTSAAATGWEAAARANRAAGALIAYAATHAADTRVRLASFATAVPPLRPSSPVLLISVAVGACGAVTLACLLRLAWWPARRDDRDDDRLEDRHDDRRAPEPALSGANA